MNCIHTRPHQWRVVTVFQLLVGLLFSLSTLGQPAFSNDAVVVGQQELATFVVSAKSDIFLSGADSTAIYNDDTIINATPVGFQLPQFVTNQAILFSAKAFWDLGSGGPGNGADGGGVLGSIGPAFGIGAVTAKYMGLIGVFIDDKPYKQRNPAPSSLGYTKNLGVVTPELYQPFYIGTGTNDNLSRMRFVVPAGATSIYLGPMDGGTWNNVGSATVTIYKALYDYESTPPSPVIVTQPQLQSITVGNDATFCVTLKDVGTYNYQWQRNEQNIAGATLNCYTINSVTAAMDGSRYRVIVSNSAGTIISDSATLTVVTPPPPTIATQPTPKTVQEGANVSLSVVATGQGTLVYQWQFNEQNLPGATSPTLNLNAVKLNTAGRYRVLVSSQYGVTISDTVKLTVNPNPPPTIVTQPVSRTPAEGTQVSLTVTATGLGSLTYQWQVNGQNIPGATSSTLVLSAVRPSVNGNYRVIVGNPYGTTISTEATIAVVVTDSDSDGLSDYEELLFGTNANKADTDGDGLSDFAEVRTHGSNPLTTDTDGDGYSDGIEVARDGNPNNRSVTPTGALAVFPAVDVEFYTLNSVKYQLEVSTDMVSWTAQGGVVVGNGGSQNHLVRASKATQFWRLKVVQ